jgi:transcriptional regulator with XRE-family HTH domain
MSKAIDQFKEIFKESGISVPSVVKECKVADTQIYNLLNNKVLDPRIGTLNEIGKVLGFEVTLTKTK